MLDGFAYELDDAGNIVKTTHEDGSYWDYTYDDRYRLVTADRFESGGNVKAAYSYSYDDGDNMLTKVEPFFDNFDDTNYNGWSIAGGSWTAANGYLEPTSTTTFSRIRRTTSDADNECTFRYRINDTSDSNARMYITPRSVDTNNRGFVMIYPGSMKIVKVISGTQTTLQTNTSATSSANVWYNVRVKTEGSTITVWRWQDGQMPTQVLQRTDFGPAATYYYQFDVATNYQFDLDDIRILADGLANTTTFTVNNANELATMSDYNGTTTFTFDEHGRMVSKSRGSFTSSYGYKCRQMLASVTSNWPEESSANYEYGGNGKIRRRSNGASVTNYRQNLGLGIYSTEDETGVVLSTSIGSNLAWVDGANPTTGACRFMSRDNVNSIRTIRDSSKARIGDSSFAPYGEPITAHGTSSKQQFTGHPYDDAARVNIAPFRTYSPSTCRWLTPDPFGMSDGTNLYAYVTRNCINSGDPTGLKAQPGHFDIACDSDGVSIYYQAPESAQCDEIKFIQIVKTNQTGIDFWKPGHYWHVDDELPSGEEPDSPYYPHPLPEGRPRPTSAGMTDQPNPGGIGGTQDFETCAVCAKGTDKGDVYGCRKWSATTGPLGGRSYSGCDMNLPGQAPSQIFKDTALAW